jgi:2Fe-2S ferredoxin
MPKVKFLPSGIEVEAASGDTLLDIALSGGVAIQHACGGFCACTTCHCEIIDGVTELIPADSDEIERLEVLENRTDASRLACQTKIKGDVTVRVVNGED